MRWTARRVGLTLVSTFAGGGAVLWCASRGASHSTPPPPPLSAAAFNALQDAKLLDEAFQPAHLPWRHTTTSHGGRDFEATLFRLLGCPYCAKVEWLLRYHAVPFRVTEIDPLSGAGLPDTRYQLVPQLQLTPIQPNQTQQQQQQQTQSLSAKEEVSECGRDSAGVFVVDSQHIIEAIAVPLGFAHQLRDTRVETTRRWITDRFQAVSFVATNGTWGDAFATYPIVTPARYHNMAFRVVGASVLYALSRYKIAPNLDKHTSISDTNLSTAITPKGKDASVWLEGELAIFADRLRGEPFHGGKSPDLADVEMYAVTRVVDAHPTLRDTLRRGEIGKWRAAMEAEVQKRAQV